MAESSQASAKKNAQTREMRDAFGDTLVELGNLYEDMVFLDADLHTSTKATTFKKAFPDRFYQVGIAEQNLFGLAAGFATEGFIAIPSTFAAFASRRALDQLAISICFPALNVKIPGSYVGVPTSRAGASHNCIEDIAVMRALPNLKVADPGTGAELAAVMRRSLETPGPVYYRVTRYGVPELFDDGYEFEWGKGVTLRTGSDVTLVGTGVMTHRCLSAAEALATQGVQAEVLHMPSIKPMDSELLRRSAQKTRCVVTAENATINGGFGAAVAETLSESCPVPVYRIGVRDQFVESGGVEDLFEAHQMQPRHIVQAAKHVMEMREEMSSWLVHT